MKIILAIIAAQLTFCIFFLVTRLIGCYRFPAKTKPNQPIENKTMKPETKLRKLIQATNGQFFSIQFRRKDGTVRIANGKNSYKRLLASPDSPKAGWNPLSGTKLESFVDRSKEDWICASDERLIRFKCGSIEETF